MSSRLAPANSSATGRRTVLRRIATALGGTALAAGTLITAHPATAAADTTEATWTLNTFNETLCREPNPNGFSEYWNAEVAGTWTSTITSKLENVPGVGTLPGGSVAPGSNTTHQLNLWGMVHLNPMPAVGSYPAELVATDGTTTETGTINIVVKDDCYS